MKRSIEKLHSRRGASILLALLLMLVAAMISAVIISASVSAVDRVRNDVEEQQDALAIASAGRVVMAYMTKEPTFTYHWYAYSELDTEGPFAGANGQESIPSSLVERLAALTGDRNNTADVNPQTLTLTVNSDKVENAGMEFTVKPVQIEGSNLSADTFDVVGTVYLGATKADSPQRLYFSAILTMTELREEESKEHMWRSETKKYIDGDGKEQEEEVPIPNTKYTVTWTLSGVRLVSREELIAE